VGLKNPQLQKIIVVLALGGVLAEDFKEERLLDKSGVLNFAAKISISVNLVSIWPFLKITKSEISNELIIMLYSSQELGKDSYLGEVRVQWKSAVLHIDEWFIN